MKLDLGADLIFIFKSSGYAKCLGHWIQGSAAGELLFSQVIGLQFANILKNEQLHRRTAMTITQSLKPKLHLTESAYLSSEKTATFKIHCIKNEVFH